MNKVIRLIFLSILLLALVSCSGNKTTVNVDYNNESSVNEASTIETVDDSFNEYDVLITCDAINIRSDSTVSDNNKVGIVKMGETYTVIDEYRDDKYIWRKIGDKQWIADDGSWCTKFKTEEYQDYPYVINAGEDEEFNKIINHREKAGTAYTDDASYLINMFPDSNNQIGCNILFSTRINYEMYSYKYNISNVVKVSENVYDIYITPVENDGLVDNCTGYIEISNHELKYMEGAEYEYYEFNVEFKQNSTNSTDEILNHLYNNKIHFLLSGSISL